MKERNINDMILRLLQSQGELRLPDLISKLSFNKEEIELSLIKLQGDGYIDHIKPLGKGDFSKFKISNKGFFFINSSSYFEEYRKESNQTRFKYLDKIITLSGIILGIIFGLVTCARGSNEKRLIEIISKKDSIIHIYQNTNEKTKRNKLIESDSLN